MSIWQTPSWKKLLLESNQAEKVIEIDNIFVEKRSIWLGKYWLFVLWLNEDKKIDDKKMLELCKKEKALFLQIETFNPDWVKDIEIKNFKKWYYKKFITPHTALIDVTQTEDEILKFMKPKWRYNIKLATKKWVEVQEVEKTDENIKIFYDLMLETTSRDNFNGNKFEYYKHFLENIEGSYLLLAYFEGKAIAWGIFVKDKDVSIYYYWASTSNNNYRNLMAPYLVQWTAILKSKEFWSKYYDFLGIASPGEKDSHLAWVTDFKLKFTSLTPLVSKSYIYIENKFIYNFLVFSKRIKKLFK